MPRTPDNIGGPLIETEYAQFYDDYGAIPDEVGTLVYFDGYFYMRDAYGVYNPRYGTGISESEHEVLDTLVHEIDETSYDEVAYAGSSVVSYIVWASAAKLKKIREETYTYVSGKASHVVTKQYDDAGLVKMTMTEDYTYSGSKVLSVTRVKT
jgi:hypothetical protein